MAAFLLETSTGTEYPLEDFNLVGRTEDASIQVVDGGVSRQHASIRRDGAHYWLADLGSSNGTYVNDLSVTSARVLHDGDVILFGEAGFVFQQVEESHLGDTLGEDLRTTFLKKSPGKVKKQPVTLLIGDLKGFTSLSSLLTAEEVAEVMREWYNDCNEIMQRTGGMIDKFIGDCVFAYWPSIDRTTRAHTVEAARMMRAAEARVSSPARLKLREEHGITLDCGIGLHLGEVAVGSMGKGVNTALGDAVNVAFRIESLTRPIGRSVLASGDFLHDWPEGMACFDPCGFHELKGHPLKIEIFALRE